MNASWHVELLGWLRAEQGDRVASRFRTQKTGALLAYLALTHSAGTRGQRSHSREELIELLWPESEPELGRLSLRQALSSLRRQLESPGVPPGTLIVADRASVRLNPAAFTTDVTEFEAALRAAARAGSRVERTHRLVEAVELYRGELLPGYYEEWALAERRRLAEAFLEALGQLSTLREQEGDLQGAIQCARRAVAADPLREEQQQQLIRLLTAAGQSEAALRQYQDLERLLAQELGAKPSPELRALAAPLQARAARPEPKGLASDARAQATAIHPPELEPQPSEPAAAPRLPTGTVTFLLTDIEGSTALWEQRGHAFATALASHHALLRRLFSQHGGFEAKEIGDAFIVAFQRARDALACAIAGQRALAAYQWPEAVGPLWVRMALHTGDVEWHEGEYHDLVLHYAQRILLAGHGGQILCSEATAVLLRRELEPALRLVDRGVYRLRDVAAPERLFQVEYPAMARREFPPLNAPAGYDGHLPLQFTRFFGREAEINRLRELLLAETGTRTAGGRLLTVTGLGGTGKTRLALAVAAELREAFQGAVWFVGLADLTDPHLIAHKVLDALRLPRSPQFEPLDQVVTFLSRQPSLLLLDNFEHLLPSGAPLLQQLLERVEALTALVTSRQRLSVVGEQEFLLSPLPVPAEREGTEQLLRYASVRLFADRAQAARPDFQVRPGNAAAVADLCARLEGLPLALELAAARAGVLTPAQILKRLSQRFALLVSWQRNVTARQHSLRASLDWSFHLLSPELQRFFTRLSVFRGGWTLEAAEAVWGGPGAGERKGGGALEYLAQLRSCSLVVAEETGEEMRYRLLETLREYGAEQLTPPEQAAMAQRHLAYYLALAERVEPELFGPQQGEWLERLEREHDNLRAALRWAETSREAEAGLRLATALRRYWSSRGYVTEGRHQLEALLALPGARERSTVRASALEAAGSLALGQGDYEGARSLLEESLTTFRRLEDKLGIARSLTSLGEVAQAQGGVGAARSAHEESLTLRRELGCKWGIACSLNYLGEVAAIQGDLGKARALIEESLPLWRELGDQRGTAWSLTYLAGVAYIQGDLWNARSLIEQGLSIRRALAVKPDIAWTLMHLGKVALGQGDAAAAADLFAESLALFTELDHKGGIASILLQQGRAALLQGDAQAAQVLTEECLEAFRALDSKLGIACARRDLGIVASLEGDQTTARLLLEESVAMLRELDDKWGIAEALNDLGTVALRQGEYAAARAFHTESLALWRNLGNRWGAARCLEGLAGAAAAEAQAEQAVRLLGSSHTLREAVGAPLQPIERADYDRLVSGLRTALDAETFGAAWAQGRALPWERVAAQAVGEELPSRLSAHGTG